MKLYAIILTPVSGFGTTLKGDTIFGHFCWQAAYDPSLLQGGLEQQIAAYSEKPFAVFSSAFPVVEKEKTAFAFKRPELPFSFMLPAGKDKAEDMRQRKDFKKKKWMLIGEDLHLDVKTANFISDQGLLEEVTGTLSEGTRRQMGKAENAEFLKLFSQAHNSINRMTQTTGTGNFAPYAKENIYYLPDTKLAVFVLIEETATDIDRVTLGLKRIGISGFGRDASTGLGRYKTGKFYELPLSRAVNSNACYTLAPCVPAKGVFKESFFSPFVRFGKHGDRLAAYGNPFKNPVIMADEGAVLIPDNKNFFNRPYTGQAVNNVSKAIPETVVQGYAPYIPFKLEMN